ncbi:hypothetical protein QBK99_12780 [Corticibacterium sp. UT-5YL-CI-8]|nr:hypothetical protein [Tianweitania sp. UT-5YL-CI-8]
MATMTFYSWQRPALLADATEDGGRLRGAIPLQIDDVADAQGLTETSIPVYLRSAADVASLKPSAIRHMAPRPSTADAETTKLVHLDFHEADLPWRYSPKASPQGGQATPWLVLLVGTEDEMNPQGGIVVPGAGVLQAHDLAHAHRWAHVHDENGARFSRLVSPRILAPLRGHVAALVPAFDANGQFSWNGGALTGSHLPVFYSWRFRTGEAGDFEMLAAALRVRKAGGLGMGDIRYRRPLTDLDETLRAGGAITSLQDLPEQTEAVEKVRADLDRLNDPVEDEIPDVIPEPPEREIMQLPRYGGLWLDDVDAVRWSKSMNGDPRNRGIGGLGVRMGVVEQEQLMAAAVEQAGALQDIGQRISFLAAGLGLSSRLWNRRLPDSAEQRLQLFGPAMGRMISSDGQGVLDRVTGPDSVLQRSLFSSAAMRLTRGGSGRSRFAAGGRISRGKLMQLANQPVEPQQGNADGVIHADGLAKQFGLKPLGDAMGLGEIDKVIEELFAKFEGAPVNNDSVGTFITMTAELLGLRCYDRMGAYFGELMPPPDVFEHETMIGAINACRASTLGERAIKNGIDQLLPGYDPPDRRRPVNLDALDAAVTGAIDPTAPRPPAWVRVESTIDGIKLVSLAPPEAPIGLDYPTWTMLKRHDKEWLLPGANEVLPDSVIALRTNPAFVDAFLLGLNTQFLAEMRWRNLPAPRVSTPLRMFWGYVDHDEGKRAPDIQPFDRWLSKPHGAADADDLGHRSHQVFEFAATSGEGNLVIAFRTALFRRYPSTLVYLVRTPAGGEAALDALLTTQPQFRQATGMPDTRDYIGPIFQGEIMPDLVFFVFDVEPEALDKYWLVLDEPPTELRFRNDKSLNWNNAAEFAVKTIDKPTRVAISGTALETLGEAP